MTTFSLSSALAVYGVARMYETDAANLYAVSRNADDGAKFADAKKCRELLDADFVAIFGDNWTVAVKRTFYT